MHYLQKKTKKQFEFLYLPGVYAHVRVCLQELHC